MVDELDQKLIMELQKDGRKSWVDIARSLGVTEGTVRNRVKALLDSKKIKILAVPDLRSFGYRFISIIGLQVRMAELATVGEVLAQKANVCYLAFVTGRYDLMAMIITQSPEELSQFITKEISAIPSILRTETFVNLNVIKGQWLDTIEIIRNTDFSLLNDDQRNR